MFALDTLIGNTTVNAICEYALLLVVLINYHSLFENKPKLKSGFLLLWLFLTVFSLFYSPADGDSFTSLDNYRDFLLGGDTAELHFEPIYFLLMSVVSSSYVAWRFVIWGTAALIFTIILIKENADVRVSLFFWAYLGWQAFYYQRISLAFALMFAGVVILLSIVEGGYCCKHRFLKVIMAIILILASTFFHRTMPIYLIIALLVLVMPTSKWSVAVLLIVMPMILTFVLQKGSLYLMNSSDEIQMMADIYLDAANVKEKGNLNSQIFNVFKWFPYAGMIMYCIYDLLKCPSSFSKTERFFLLYAGILYLLSFMLSGIVSDSFGGKMKIESVFSMTIFLILYYRTRKQTVQCNVFAKAAMWSFVIIFIYSHLF